MFAATGWRVGWLIGPASILTPTLAATTRIVFCSNSPLQEASAVGLEQAKKRGFLLQQRDEYAERRAILTAGFDKLGMKYTLPQGSYFVLLVRARVIPSVRPVADSPLPFSGYIHRAVARGLPVPAERGRQGARFQVGDTARSGAMRTLTPLATGRVGSSRWKSACLQFPSARYAFIRLPMWRLRS